MIVSIDGGAATGKSTIAKMLSKEINFVHLNSGLLYRAVTFILIKENFLNESSMFYKKYFSNLELQIKGENLNIIFYKNENITSHLYSQRIAKNIKYVSNNRFIREYITSIQRDLSKNINVVCEGRDIGSVVFPNADFKFFLKCDIKERVKRRYKQFINNNIVVDKKELKTMILQRDKNDINRKNSPLKIVDGSILIDTTSLSLEDIIKMMCEKIKEKYDK